jgi:hypothetical protein
VSDARATARLAFLALALAGVAGAWSACRRADADPETSPAAQAHPGALVLDAAALRRSGIETAAVSAVATDGAREVFGRVLDPTPLAEAVAARDAARAVLAAAASERKRVRALARADENASQRELEVAETAFRRAELDLAAAEARLRTSWGTALAERADLERESEALVRSRAAVARVELLPGEADLGTPAAVALAAATLPEHALEAELIGPAPTTDPLTQGPAYLVRIAGEPPPPGTALVGHLVFPAAARSGLRISRSAVVRQAGRTWVYREREGGRFERVPVSLVIPLGADWLATGALPVGARIVAVGAQELLSAELLGAAPAD